MLFLFITLKANTSSLGKSGQVKDGMKSAFGLEFSISLIRIVGNRCCCCRCREIENRNSYNQAIEVAGFVAGLYCTEHKSD